jgi:hypothetical protein
MEWLFISLDDVNKKDVGIWRYIIFVMNECILVMDDDVEMCVL